MKVPLKKTRTNKHSIKRPNYFASSDTDELDSERSDVEDQASEVGDKEDKKVPSDSEKNNGMKRVSKRKLNKSPIKAKKKKGASEDDDQDIEGASFKSDDSEESIVSDDDDISDDDISDSDFMPDSEDERDAERNDTINISSGGETPIKMGRVDIKQTFD
eukprot:GFUD01136373.1.p1 GENE.GFUD01136373.1~~GFUD01136373.1.p1  ORF type:complete len:160 (+),score=58.12 GFUD01136373.1:1-480(+)